MLVFWLQVEAVNGSNGCLTCAAGTLWLGDSRIRRPYEYIGSRIGSVYSLLYRGRRRSKQRVIVFYRGWVGQADAFRSCSESSFLGRVGSRSWGDVRAASRSVHQPL